MPGGGFDLAAHYGRAQSHDCHQGLMGQVMSRMLAMRMLSSHPQLLRLSRLTSSIARYQQPGRSTPATSRRLACSTTSQLNTAKLDALLEHAEEILAEDPRHKLVVFSLLQADARDDRG